MDPVPSERWQTIAPASDEPGQQRLAADSRKRRQAVPVACVQCRGGKARCDGVRPTCIRCQTNDFACQYDVAEGVSRAERMKILKRDTLARKVEELERIIDFLRSKSDNEATTVLAKLRLGDRVEDVAKFLPAASPSAGLLKPPNLLSQDSADSSRSVASHNSAAAYSESEGHSFPGRGSTASPVSFSERRSSMPYATSARGENPPIADSDEESPFLSPLFDRQDYLLPGFESDNDDEVDVDNDSNVDPRLMGRGAGFDAGTFPAAAINLTTSAMSSPQREDTIAYATQLRHRQPMVNTIRLHPNLNLRNLFGNLPLSSSIWTNNYPQHIQETQINNLSVPTWSMMPVTTRPDPGSMRHAFGTILGNATELIQSGTPVERVIETHPNIAALYSPAEFERSGILSRWAVGMVHAVQRRGDNFTCFASMYLCWYLMRWMIYPSPETYAAIPEWLRPTPNQLFMPHINILDYIAWPAFREYAVQIPSMQHGMMWLMDMSLTLRCDWQSITDLALCQNEETELWDLCHAAKQTMRDLTKWSVGPSFRGYVSNADSYVKIRTEYPE